MKREATAEKILVLGVDGMDPRFTKYMLDNGKMPTLKKFLARGSAREDLEMLGAQPTVTPPGWTTLATGAYSYTHGITGYDNPGEELGYISYALNSRLCQAEQAWNCFAEAGKKTLVFHWPGSSWPPSLDSPYLHVIDGSQPGAVNTGVAMTEMEFLLVASDQTDEVVYKKKAASDTAVPCVINDLVVMDDVFDIVAAKTQGSQFMSIGMSEEDTIYSVSTLPMDLVYSPLKPAEGWAFELPEGAKEFVMLLSSGLIRRQCLLYKKDGDFKVAIYKNKKNPEPVFVLDNDVLATQIIDEGFMLLRPGDDKKYTVNRSMRILDVAEDASSVRMYISSAMDIANDAMWWPKHLHETVIKECGYPLPTAFTGGCDKTLITKCLHAAWVSVMEWQSKAMLKLIEVEDYDVIFSHFHSVDGEAHQLIKYLIERPTSKIPPEEMLPLFEELYILVDEYLAKFMHLLDQGWTVLLTSDHGQVCPAHKPPMICDSDVSLRVMQELGLTDVKRDENGNELREIDWDKTMAVNTRSNHVYINLKGRDPHGIVEPEDKYEAEEEVMTRLYGYKDKVTGKRIIQLALRNRDAVLLGMGGDRAGDIIIWTAEGYNYDHCDGLSTAWGEQHTSMNCIFVAAGPGIKQNFKTTRVIRQVDFAPTVCTLGGVRMPKQCEGAPVYQVFEGFEN